MWSQSFSQVYSGIRKEDVWAVWVDVNRYTEWHDDLASCTMTGPFAVGNYFELKPKGAPVFTVELLEVIEGRKFVDCTKLWGAKMYDSHELTETPAGLRISNTVTVTGILGWLWVRLVARGVANSAAKETEALVQRVRARYA